MKMVAASLLAPALLWLVILRGAEEAASAPGGSRPPSADPRPFLLGALPGGEENTSEHPAWEASARARPSAPPLEVRRISGVLEKSSQISASALVFAAFCGWGVMLPFCQPQKLQIRGKVGKWLSIYANGLACLASALALVALILWSYDQGFPAVFIFPTILLLHVILVTALVLVTIIFQLDILHQVTDRAAQRMLDLTTPGGAILVAVISGLLIKRIRQLEVDRQTEPVGLMAVVAGAAGMCLFPAVVIVVVDCVDSHKRAEEERISRKKRWREAVQQGLIILS